MSYEIKKFKDGQIASKITKQTDLHIKIRGNSYEDLFTIASIKEAWDAAHNLDKTVTSILTIYCLMAQRSDRRFNEKESFDLKVVARFINSLKFDKVEILHPHSAISLAMIDNSTALDHFEYVERAFKEIGHPVLVSPDAGAYKTTHQIAELLHADLVPSNKVRVNGAPQISIQGDVKGKKCLIIDDLADGGRTFKNLAQELKNQGATAVYLYVTHGQFNYGFEELKEVIDKIYCTNSYKDIEDAFVTQFTVVE
ncbi:ribose-phosphate pyrophosphokinase [Nonlabens dokdonensis]|uniref:Ribose-phosphate pyrophosphokinase n=2 Tax=Nonlabens dokdonensis TaxID=328515 RepID=L7W2R3_NONDD|nr:phosphoribosyltransferase family protein [Nonlabens dokdonensis]AGC75775.1 ribose-phosphate pyrophosphokinase [Nonlabens dokdonensis DSW-6]PZX43457.1 ribose-phosphate pyrophosphokinase [Nonlabens dokdonensis]